MIATLLILALTMTQPPETLPPPAEGPRPRAVVPGAPHDFGLVALGTDPEVDFTINNAGDAPLEIGVVPLPRGLRMVRADRTIAPKRSGAIRVALDTFQANPTNELIVRATTNDPEAPEIRFTIKAEIRAYVTMTPPAARFTFVQFGAEGGTKHVLAATDGANFAVTRVESSLSYITAKWRELKADDREKSLEGRQFQVEVTISPKAPIGPIGGYITVTTNHPKQPRAFLPVSGFVRPLFAVTPFKVSLPGVRTADLGKPVALLVVKNFGAEALDLTGVKSDIAGLDASIERVEAGHHWRVAITLPPTLPAGAFKGTLRLATTSRNVPELVVPIDGNRADAR